MGDEATTDVENILTKAIEHHRQGELTKAEWGYLEILEHFPEHADALQLLGVIAHQMGNATLAIERVEKSLSINPDQPTALNNLGNMLAETDRLEEAIASYQRAIALKPDYAQAHHNLGNVLADSHRPEASLESYRRALELQPEDVASRLAVGAMLEKLGEFDDAANSYRKVVAVQSDSVVARNRLGAVLRKMDRLAEARVVYDEWLRLAPNDPVASHFRAVCEPGSVPDRASADYVKAAFDDFAEEFDSCLADLNYRVPELLGTMLQKHWAKPCGRWDVADLGCGTGLCSSHLRDYASRLVGVDLALGMLAKARERNVYDELIEEDLTEFLKRCSAEYDLLVAADTLIYVGDLQSTFVAAAGALREGGILLFSIEKLVDESCGSSYRLNPFGRYVHSLACVRRWLDNAGFEVQELVEETLRNEGSDSTVGCLVMAHRAPQRELGQNTS